MATSPRLEERCYKDYPKFFDANDYLGRRFSTTVEDNQFLNFAMSSLHDIYRNGKVSGKRLVDIGSGPTIHSLIPAAKWFEEIYISDFCQQNTEAVQKWLARDTQAHDWQNYFQFFARKDGDEDAWQQYENILRARIKSILFCDFHQSNPLCTENLGLFDAVTTSNALISGNKDINGYKQSLKNVAALLKPGGYFLEITVLNCSYYVVGGDRFKCVPITVDEVLTAVKDAGVDVIQQYVDDQIRRDNEESSKYSGGLVVLGMKQ